MTTYRKEYRRAALINRAGWVVRGADRPEETVLARVETEALADALLAHLEGRAVVLSGRELGTVLAALRSWQQRYWQDPELETIATDGGAQAPLEVEEIDALCQKINCGGARRPR